MSSVLSFDSVRNLIGQKTFFALDEAGLAIVPRLVMQNHEKKIEALSEALTAVAEKVVSGDATVPQKLPGLRFRVPRPGRRISG